MDFLATKGIEYLIVIAYLLVLIPFWALLRGRPAAVPVPALVEPRRATPRGWFQVPADRYFHRGHTWAQALGSGRFRIGLDDFAGKLLGRPEAMDLPSPGSRLSAGDRGWAVHIDGHAVDLLSPVGGEVTAVNPEVLADPALASADPYGRGWLLEMRVPREVAATKNLLPGELARTWTDEAASRLFAIAGSPLGTVLQDGGVPVSGFARVISPDGWQELAAELLLTA